MNHNNKDQVARDIVCRSHSARSERDLYRVCPSKLNKRELEDLYYALLENNLELKRSVNGQKDQIKTLSTKVQRMAAAQKSSFSRESRECCLSTKAVVNEQKDIIAELKKSNERMSERIRLLNMRLCSAKQFVKRSPTQLTTRCIKCSTQPPNSPKNSSTIALTTIISESNLKTPAVSCQDLNKKDMPSTRSVQTETNEQQEKRDPKKPCEENKCRSLMEELKQKIVNLQEELSTTHTEYSSRIGRLETEVSSLQARDREGQEIASRLTRAEVRNGELAMELAIEKGKVAELETSVKAAQMSSKVAATIEGHLASMNQARRESYSRPTASAPSGPAESEERSPTLQARQSTPVKVVSPVDFKLDNYDIKPAKYSDDSGYTEANKSTEISDDKGLNKVNQELMKKIVDLQTQLDQFQVTSTVESEINGKISESPVKSDATVNGKLIEPLSMFVQNDGCVIEPIKNDVPEPSVGNISDVKKNELNVERSTANDPLIENKQSSTIIPEAKHPLVLLNDGQKNLEDTDEGSYTIHPNDKPSTPEPKPSSSPPAKDDHNKYQIPGPIGSDTIKTYNSARRQSNGINKYLRKEARKSKEDETDMVKTETQVQYSPKKKTQEEDKMIGSDANNSKETHDMDSVSVKIVDDKSKKDSVETMRLRFIKKTSKAGKSINVPVIEENGSVPENGHGHSLTNYQMDPTKSTRLLSVEQRQSVPEEKNTQDGTQIDYQAAVETCPPYKPPVVDMPATYTVPTEDHNSRTSEKDTDHEISAMTDLSTERDEKSPAETLSPGEDKATGTCTRSYSAPTTDYGTLSEGELPTVARVRKLSIGERRTTNLMPGTHQKYSQQNMEEALHAITEELARCKQLLLKQRQHQRENAKSMDAEMVDLCPAPIALKRAPGNQRIGDTFTPKCIFTLHIGTVVLSDEAVVKSRDMSLVLTWKFYDQNLTMTRMRAGRVVFFDFSTEYDVKITEDFLNYMKQEQMPIIICELDKQNEPFARCALPLRDALLHTNRRADISLALMAGPQLAHPLGRGNEVGVLDLWCMLRAEPRLLPAFNRAIAWAAPRKAKSNSLHHVPWRSASRVMEQVLADDQSNDHLSQELELNVSQLQRQSEANTTSSSPWNTRDASVVSRGGHLGTKSDTPSIVPGYGYYDRNVQASNPHVASKLHRTEEVGSQAPSSVSLLTHNTEKHEYDVDTKEGKRKVSSSFSFLSATEKEPSFDSSRPRRFLQDKSDQVTSRKYDNISRILESCKVQDNLKKSVTINHKYCETPTVEIPQKDESAEESNHDQSVDITILWLALNEECEAINPKIQRLYVAYSFLGWSGADLETPISLPKPKNYVDKCYFNFKKTFQLHDCDLPLLGHMARCRSTNRSSVNPEDCIIFSVVSEPPEDPLGLDSCEDIGQAYLYLGDILSFSAGSNDYTEVLPVVCGGGVNAGAVASAGASASAGAGASAGAAGICGVLAVRLDGLTVVRRCLTLSNSLRNISMNRSGTSLRHI